MDLISPLFESLLLHSMTLIESGVDNAEAMVVDESKMFSDAETGEEPKFKLELNDKEINLEEMGWLGGWPRLKTVKALWLDANEFGDDGVALLANWPTLARLNTLSLAHNKITVKSIAALAESKTLRNLKTLFVQYNRLGPKR